jgi:hypothetical protein
MTAPRVGPRTHGGPHAGRVEMEVAYQLQEIRLPIAEDGLVTALKDMPGLVIAAVVVLAIGKLESLHRAE